MAKQRLKETVPITSCCQQVISWPEHNVRQHKCRGIKWQFSSDCLVRLVLSVKAGRGSLCTHNSKPSDCLFAAPSWYKTSCFVGLAPHGVNLAKIPVPLIATRLLKDAPAPRLNATGFTHSCDMQLSFTAGWEDAQQRSASVVRGKTQRTFTENLISPEGLLFCKTVALTSENTEKKIGHAQLCASQSYTACIPRTHSLSLCLFRH